MDSLTTTPSSPTTVADATGPEQYLSVYRAWHSPGVEVCTPAGEIDLHTAPVLRRALREAEQRPAPQMVIDLSQVAFLSAAGIHVLRTAAEQAAAGNRQLVLVVATRLVRRVLQATGAHDDLVVYPSLGEATSALTLPPHPDEGARHRRDDNDDDDEDTERAEWGLRRYVHQVALALGVEIDSACCEATGAPANAYLALTQRLPSAPDRDVALFWDAPHGWALGIDTGCGEDILVTAYLGGPQSIAGPETVAAFARTLLAGQHAGQPHPPVWPDHGALTSHLADYAPTEAG